MLIALAEDDVTHVDEDSVILSDRGDCVMFLRPVRKGRCLHEINCAAHQLAVLGSHLVELINSTVRHRTILVA